MKRFQLRWGIALVAILYSSLGFAQTRFKSLNYLYSIAGKQTLSGIHNREPNATPAAWTNKVQATTGQYPGLWSGDFLFQAENIENRGLMIKEAKEQWKKGALINIMWHACNPARLQPCGWDSTGVLSQLNDTQWKQLLTEGTAINARWKGMMDEIAVYLQDLEDNDVEVFFRPLHEMNQKVFWWGGRPGPEGTAQLFRLTHDYFTHTKGLSNLIWVWDMQDFKTMNTDLVSYNPGSKYWDVVALDMYWSDGTGYTAEKYEAFLKVAEGKPIAIGECEVLPTLAELAAQPKWTFFMGWSELVFAHKGNTTPILQELFNHPQVVTLGEMPGWTQTQLLRPNLAHNRPVKASSNQAQKEEASHAVDAKRTTYWWASAKGSQYITVDLGANYAINGIKLTWEKGYAKKYKIQFSTDNTTWTTAKNIKDNSAVEHDLADLSGKARYVKIYCTKSALSSGYTLHELQVYGTPQLISNEKAEAKW